jgi:hypothetical protein
LSLARRQPWFARHGTAALSLLIVLLGSYWVIERLGAGLAA